MQSAINSFANGAQSGYQEFFTHNKLDQMPQFFTQGTMPMQAMELRMPGLGVPNPMGGMGSQTTHGAPGQVHQGVFAPEEQKPSGGQVAAGVVAGAVSGAKLGSTFGVPGMVVGAIAGGLFSLF